MSSTISTSFMRHGKRLKVEVTTDDLSPEDAKAAHEELGAKLRQMRKAAAARVVRQSFRKKKAPKNG